jgi:hypothetical protein|tara:strand:- start:4 stop:906 length:903 start_codon:yes stop_codon:yes gene_type:complete
MDFVMKKPFTIKLFMPDGDAASLKIITKMNWTGVGVELSRAGWKQHRGRDELSRAGIYILVGQEEGDELPKLYIGQGDGVKNRIEDHSKKKPFWDRALIFVSSNDSLNRAHITWLEWALIERAQRIGRYNLDNSAIPNEPGLTESEKADTQEFLDEILSILPLVEVNAFEQPKKIESAPNQISKSDVEDTVVVPAQAEGFKKVFLGENCWYAIRIGGGRLEQIKYIAAYQTSPVSAITHIAEVSSIEPYGDGKKYKLNFAKPARRFGPLKLGNAHGAILQGPRYTSLVALENAKDIGELF